MPEGLVLDGELIVLGHDGRPSFPLLSQRMLMRRLAE
jgi:ATP-dependent DNA ligase